ncbi:MAG: SIR2 family protein [Agrobacterium cavarae]
MPALGRHLMAEVPASLISSDTKLWNELNALIPAVGLEAALLKHAPSPSLETSIVRSTGDFVAHFEARIIAEVLSNAKTLRLTKLIPHLLRPNSGIPIVTTNYDRLVELACEEAGLGVDTMFRGHFAARLDPEESHWSFCRNVKFMGGKNVRYIFAPKANVFKPHGSLDWYHREGSPVRHGGTLPLPRLIITPGLNKYRTGYESPFDKHRERANDAIDRASRFLVVGYGFNDDHLETHLTPRIRSGVKTMILTQGLSAKAREIATSNKNVIAAEAYEEAGVPGTRFIIDGAHIFFPGLDYWDLGGFVNGVLAL